MLNLNLNSSLKPFVDKTKLSKLYELEGQIQGRCTQRHQRGFTVANHGDGIGIANGTKRARPQKNSLSYVAAA
jgi:hypothetical protein